MKIEFLLIGLIVMAACTSTHQKEDSLKHAFADDFFIGAALNTRQYQGKDERALKVIEQHINAITPENDMKWEKIHPQKEAFFFDDADAYVAFGEEHDQYILGHTLVWHSQTPEWVFKHEDGSLLSRDELLARMEHHIKTIVGRYKGRVDGWDVVNEALNDDGTMRESYWYQIIGDDFVAKAFQFANEADPEADLFYNDYSMNIPEKADGAVALVKGMQEQGIRVTGVGMQGHYGLFNPPIEEFENSIIKFKALGDIAITELDIDVLPLPWDNQGADVNLSAEYSEGMNPYAEGLPDSVQAIQTQRYKELFEVMLKHADAIHRVTFWGVTDGDSWKNGWPIAGRTNYPLLFDRKGNPKPAVETIIELTKAE